LCFKVQIITGGKFDINYLKYNIGNHMNPIRKIDEIRRAYLKWCSYQIQIYKF